MRTDSLQEFVKLRRKLTDEKSQIEKRLRQINDALGEMPSGAGASAPASDSGPAQPARTGGAGGGGGGGRGGRRKMSPEARARIAEAQRRRWAASRKGQGGGGAQQKPAQAKGNGSAGKRTMSAAGRRAIAEAARRRWAAAKAAGKTRL